MGRSPCCDKVGLKKGPWTPEEDQKLLAYIEEHGHGSWRALPAKAGLQRCGKSCRLRWTNYLRPDIKRGKFSLQEEQTIIQLHALLGNRWSAIATHLPKRTDNEIKNYWNTHLKKRLTKMGIDPITHKPKNDALLSGDGQTNKNAANLSHMAQWESARLEAEARLVRESKLRSHSFQHHHQLTADFAPSPSLASASTSAPAPATLINKPAWNIGVGVDHQLESPTSTLTFSENNNNLPLGMNNNHLGIEIGLNTSSSAAAMIEFVGTSSGSSDHHNHKGESVKVEGDQGDWKGLENSVSFTSSLLEMTMSIDGSANWNNQNNNNGNDYTYNHGENSVEEGFTNLLLNDSVDQSLTSDSCKDSENSGGGDGGGSGGGGESGSDYYHDNKNYWNSILNLVNSSPSDSPMF